MLPGYLLALREGLEAALVIGIIFSVLSKMEQRYLGRTVWLGVLCGVCVSLLTALVFNQVGMTFEGKGEQIFEAIVMLFAAGIITWMVFWMRKQSGEVKSRIEQTVRQSVSSKSKWAIFGLAFLTLVREGIELALFLLAIRLEINPEKVLIGALLGIFSAVLIGVIVFSSTRKLSMTHFFKVTNVLLAIFAAGLVGLGVHELNELGWVPALIDPVWNLNSILPEQSTLGQLLKGMVGYKSNPSLSMVIGYFGYYLLLAVIFWYKNKKPIEIKK